MHVNVRDAVQDISFECTNYAWIDWQKRELPKLGQILQFDNLFSER